MGAPSMNSYLRAYWDYVVLQAYGEDLNVDGFDLDYSVCCSLHSTVRDQCYFLWELVDRSQNVVGYLGWCHDYTTWRPRHLCAQQTDSQSTNLVIITCEVRALQHYFCKCILTLSFWSSEAWNECSGPARFDWMLDENVWVYRRNKTELVSLLEQELSKLLGSPISLKKWWTHHCLYCEASSPCLNRSAFIQ